MATPPPEGASVLQEEKPHLSSVLTDVSVDSAVNRYACLLYVLLAFFLHVLVAPSLFNMSCILYKHPHADNMLRSPDSLPNGKADLQEKQANATVNDAAVTANRDLSSTVNGHSGSETPLTNGVDDTTPLKEEAVTSDSPPKSEGMPTQSSLGEILSAQTVSQTTDATSETSAAPQSDANQPTPNPSELKSAEPSNPVAPPRPSDRTIPENSPALQDAPGIGSDVDMQDSGLTAPQQDAPPTLPHHPSSTTKPESTSATLTSKEIVEPVSPSVDQNMTDAPPSPSKVQRVRDVDPGDEPAAKRTKTNGDAPEPPEFKVPDAPVPASASADTPVEGGSDITPMQHKWLTKSISSLKRMHDARFFKEPVDPIKLNIPKYTSIITHPMDLSTIEKKLKSGQYSTVQALVDDFNLMVQNSVTFNGPEHTVAQEGLKLKATFEKQMVNLPKPDEVEEKKPKKSVSTAPRAPAVRRESRSVGGQTPSRQTATSPQSTTFALGPEGLPLIRRDSTTADGRPKRSIHPPKRDLPYSSKPKKKKYQWELKFCQEVLDELHKPKYYNIAAPFYYPVDPVALNIPTYHSVIKKPMDMSTVQTKLKAGQYENAKEMEVDMRQIFKNCFKFNIPGDPTYVAGKKLEEIFDAKWSQKTRWLETHDPTAGHHSASSDEDSEEEVEDSDDDVEQEKLQLLQRQIAEMSKQVEAITAKKKKTPPASKKSGKTKSGKKDSKKSGKKDKKGVKSGKPERQHWVTYHEKQIISNGISSLPDRKMQEALKIIQNNVPALKVSFFVSFIRVFCADSDWYLGYPRD
jgi:bromodomain-containing factor 1